MFSSQLPNNKHDGYMLFQIVGVNLPLRLVYINDLTLHIRKDTTFRTFIILEII